MIVLGISPGLKALAYCVLAVPSEGPAVAEPIDADVLHGGRKKPQNPFEITRHAHAHQLILDIVCERNFPGIVVLGPPCDPNEPQDFVDGARAMVYLVGRMLKVPVMDLGSDTEALCRVLGVSNGRGLRSAVSGRIRGRMQSRDKRQWLATATAIAGAEKHRQLSAGSEPGALGHYMGAPPAVSAGSAG